jgi:PIN domain
MSKTPPPPSEDPSPASGVKLYRILIDTCIWLDLAKSYRAAPLVRALQEMCDNAQLEIIVPDIVREEFERNKDRVLAESTKVLQANLRALKSAIPTIADGATGDRALTALKGLEFATLLGGVPNIVEQVVELMNHPENISVQTSVFQKGRAAHRALYGEAPCHRDRGSIADAILFEVYDEMRLGPHREHIVYAFATTNTKDFSDPAGDVRLPHPHLKNAFNDSSLYMVDIAKFVEETDPGALNMRDLELGLSADFRSLSDLLEAEHLLYQQVWYSRHQNWVYEIVQGTSRIVPDSEYPDTYDPRLTPNSVWEKAKEAALRTEQEVGLENLGPWDDFELGMINGKLSAIRWVLGDDWDMLDT